MDKFESCSVEELKSCITSRIEWIGECQNFLNDLELLTKEEIIEAVSMFLDQTDMEATGNMNELEDKYMVNEFGRIKRTLLNRLKIMVNRQVRHKQ